MGTGNRQVHQYGFNHNTSDSDKNRKSARTSKAIQGAAEIASGIYQPGNPTPRMLCSPLGRDSKLRQAMGRMGVFCRGVNEGPFAAI